MSTRWWMESLLQAKGKAKPWLAVCVAASLVVGAGCSLLPKEEEEEVLPSITPPQLSKKPEYEVKTQTLEQKARGSGRLLSTVEEVLYFTDDGNRRIKNIAVKVGDTVQQGQLIAELDVTEVENQLKQERLQARKDELAMIEALRKSDEMSAEQLEQAKIDFELKREKLIELEQTVASSKLTAPFSGTIVAVNKKKGDTAEQYDAIATIADLSQLTVAAKFSADDLKRVAVGMEAIVDINAAGQHKGKVIQLPVPKEENDGGMGMPGGEQQESIDDYLIVQLDEFPQGLSRGTPLSVSVIIQRKENAIVIPPSTLRTYAGRNYVQVVDENGNKREVDVEIGQQTSTEVEILKGLTPGQKVVGR